MLKQKEIHNLSCRKLSKRGGIDLISLLQSNSSVVELRIAILGSANELKFH